MYKSINRTQLCPSTEKYTYFINNYEQSIKEICDAISQLRFIKKINEHQIDKITLEELHPVIRKYYIQLITHNQMEIACLI